MKKLFFKNSKGIKICAILEQPNSKKEEIVIIIHGFASDKDGTSKAVAEELSKRKIDSFRVDLSGSGESEGKFEDKTISAMTQDVSSAIKYIEKLGYKKIDLLGSSCGGTICMAAALRHRNINKLILKAPIADYPNLLIKNYGSEVIEQWKRKGHIFYPKSDGTKLKINLKINYSFYEDAKNYFMYDKVEAIKCPVLILHGEDDKLVDFHESRKLSQFFPNSILLILKKANHRLEVNGDISLSSRLCAEWIEKDISLHPKDKITGVKYYI